MLWFKHPDAVKPNQLFLRYLLLAYPLVYPVARYGLSPSVWFTLERADILAANFQEILGDDPLVISEKCIVE